MPNSWSFAPEPKPSPTQAQPAPAAASQPVVPAVEVDAPVVEQYLPAAHTVAEVQAYVEAHPDEAAQVLALEEIGKKRVSLIDWLNDLIVEATADPGE